MSMIIKSEPEYHEAELSGNLIGILRPMGLTTHMTKPAMIDLLKQAMIHCVAQGNATQYHQIEAVVNEMETWSQINVTIEY